jgi:hypothetical protein
MSTRGQTFHAFVFSQGSLDNGNELKSQLAHLHDDLLTDEIFLTELSSFSIQSFLHINIPQDN